MAYVGRATRIVFTAGAAMICGIGSCACNNTSGHGVTARDHRAPQRRTVDGISIDVPRGWTLRRNPVPGLVSPSVPFAVGSWSLPRGGECAPSSAIHAQPPTAALLWLYEYPSGGVRASDFPPEPSRFRLGRLGGPYECLGVRAYRMLFRSHGRDFQMHVVLGAHAGRLRHAVIAALSSLRVKPIASRPGASR
jgi:hypothetical protein